MNQPQLRRSGACTTFDAGAVRYSTGDAKFAKALAKQRFRTIENAASEEVSVGWTTPPDPSGDTFEPEDFLVNGERAWLRARIDRKRLPPKWVEQHVAAAERAKGKRLTARERRELKADLADKILPRVLPSTAYVDVLVSGCTVLVLTSSRSAIEAVQSLWAATFGPSKLTQQRPSEIAGEDTLKLAPTIFAGMKQREIPGTQPADFLGCELLVWMWWKCATGAGDLLVEDGGGAKRPLAIMVDELAEWRDDAVADVVLRGGFVSNEPEARAALQRGRVPTKLRMQIVEGKAPSAAVVTIAGQSLGLLSVQLPADPEDCESADDRNQERCAAWFECSRNVKDLFRAFLRVRTGKHWLKKEAAEIGAWMRS